MGMSNKQIGRELYITTNTVKTHLARISAFLEVHSRAGIVGECYRQGYFDSDQRPY
jgi:DNA-binding NarL/FixJ family response regulator